MKKWLSVLGAIILCFLLSNDLQAEKVILDHVDIDVLFSPKGGVIEAIVKDIDKAKSEILVQAYSFTSQKIANALVDAFKRNVKIEVILDKSQRTEKNTMASLLAKAGIPIYIDAKHSTAHNKIMIIDKLIVITGSCNYIKAAENDNAENLLIIPAKDLAGLYAANWEKHKKHSSIYNPKD